MHGLKIKTYKLEIQCWDMINGRRLLLPPDEHNRLNAAAVWSGLGFRNPGWGSCTMQSPTRSERLVLGSFSSLRKMSSKSVHKLQIIALRSIFSYWQRILNSDPQKTSRSLPKSNQFLSGNPTTKFYQNSSITFCVTQPTNRQTVRRKDRVI